MVVRIRLARFGRRNQPFYNIVVAQARSARNGKPMEVIGTYDPIPKVDPYEGTGQMHKDIKLDVVRAKYWIGVGAQPSDTAWRILAMAGVLPKRQFAKATPTNTIPPTETTPKETQAPEASA
ncbi:probable ribosomal protein S16, mitochondrial [Cephalotrichum gorgonifer]|uniref:Probable ribosomal protein S16, mitochondrial n=1 Tax=Cephalotrichum gorgonifer TaxID=2041049 RepID=A0AAE8MT68_9PEZI|nr:probable ribosomal protein S16, mitochondrial [Cephalotrichum gorgonifer]